MNPPMSKLRVGLITLALAVIAAIALPHAALAGEWVQVSCENPDGSAATSQGWTSSSNTPTSGSVADTDCSPTQAMTALLSSSGGAATVQSYELLTYTPPAGSTLAGGSINVSGSASGIGNASGTSVVYSPNFTYDSSDVQYQCAHSQGTCQNGNYAYDTTVTLPTNAGGDLYLEAGCGGGAGTSCSQDTLGNGTYSAISLASAELLLSNSSVPAGSGFSGTLLGSNPPASASLLFTATDANGPGVYNVNVSVDGTSVYSATPNTNSGQCASVGTYTGTSALEFDTAQPCPQEESVDVPVSTSGLSPGSHEVTATVTDAAGNTATVLDQEITIPAPATTPAPVTTPGPTATKKTSSKALKAVSVKFVISQTFTGDRTRLKKIRPLVALPRNATLTITASGPRHPTFKPNREPAKRASVLYAEIAKRTFTAGDKLVFTIVVPHRRKERLQLTFRNGKHFTAKLL